MNENKSVTVTVYVTIVQLALFKRIEKCTLKAHWHSVKETVGMTMNDAF